MFALTITACLLLGNGPCTEIPIKQSFADMAACTRGGEVWMLQHDGDPFDFHATCRNTEVKPGEAPKPPPEPGEKDI